jgi:hypothetical protein
MIYKLPKLDWFKHDCKPVENVFMAHLAGIKANASNQPEAWLGPPRKHLSGEELAKNSAIAWDIPEVKLAALFVKDGGSLYSPPTYLAGTGVQLEAQLARKDKRGPYTLGVFLRLADYTAQDGKHVVATRGMLSCTFTLQRLVPTKSEPVEIATFTVATGNGSGYGKGPILTASEPTCLKPHLVDGCLKLRAHISKIM